MRSRKLPHGWAFHRNPYDGHTLQSQIEQAAILMQDCTAAPKTAFVDLGYRGVDADNPDVRVVHRGKPKRLTAQERVAPEIPSSS